MKIRILFSIGLLCAILNANGQDRIKPEYVLQININRLSPTIPGDENSRPFVRELLYRHCDNPDPEGIGKYYINEFKTYSERNFLEYAISNSDYCMKAPIDKLRVFSDEIIIPHLKTKFNEQLRSNIGTGKGKKLLGQNIGMVFDQDIGRDTSNVGDRFRAYPETIRNLFDNNIRLFNSNSDINYRIIGSSSPEGSVAHNDRLAKDRAIAGLNWFLSRYQFITQQTLDVNIIDDGNDLNLAGDDSSRFTLIWLSQSNEFSNINLGSGVFNYNRSVNFILYED